MLKILFVIIFIMFAFFMYRGQSPSPEKPAAPEVTPTESIPTVHAQPTPSPVATSSPTPAVQLPTPESTPTTSPTEAVQREVRKRNPEAAACLAKSKRKLLALDQDPNFEKAETRKLAREIVGNNTDLQKTNAELAREVQKATQLNNEIHSIEKQGKKVSQRARYAALKSQLAAKNKRVAALIERQASQERQEQAKVTGTPDERRNYFNLLKARLAEERRACESPQPR